MVIIAYFTFKICVPANIAFFSLLLSGILVRSFYFLAVPMHDLSHHNQVITLLILVCNEDFLLFAFATLSFLSHASGSVLIKQK